MSTEQPSLPGKEELTQHMLRFIEGCAGELQRRARSPLPHWDEPYISIEPGGVRVNTAAGWFRNETPFLVLSLLHLLEVPILNRDQVVAWVKGEQRPAGHFRGDGVGAYAEDATYHACVLLRWLGAVHEEDGWQRHKLVERLRALQRPEERHMFGHLPRFPRQTCIDPEVAFHCIAALAALDETVPDPQAAISYIQSKQEAHGAFSYGWSRFYRDQPSVWATLAAVSSLTLLGAAPRDRDACVRAIQGWQAPDGGFNEKMAVWPDQITGSVTSHTAGALFALRQLGAGPLDAAACQLRLARLWSPREGGFQHSFQPHPAELIDSYWPLLGLAALGLHGPAMPHWSELFLYTVY